MKKPDIDLMLEIDAYRRAVMASPAYDPHRGTGCLGSRIEVETPVEGLPRAFVPRAMTDDPAFPLVAADPVAWKKLRFRHDFEYWAASCAVIKDKSTGHDTPLRLNRAQRRVLAVLESDRLRGRPIRMILLKARQWGGSTLIQCYMAWIQSCLRTNWHSIICAHVKDASASIRGMYTKLLRNYPPELWEGDEPPRLAGFEGSVNTREITGRGCRVTIGTSENEDAVRGADYAMAHLSEAAFWKSSPRHDPADVIRAVCGSVALLPCSLVVVESTANGVGNYFHSEWMRSRSGSGDKSAVFVPWYEIELYSLRPDDYRALAASLSREELRWWRLGLTLDQINWYRCKGREYQEHEQFAAEYPTDDVEAFRTTSRNVFNPTDVERLRRGCGRNDCATGELSDGSFRVDPTGGLKVWSAPVPGTNYVVAVDVGGRSRGADWSVIAVLTNPGEGPREVVAQWRGHIDHDLLADKAIEIARYYNEALLAVESNTLESNTCDANLFILNRMSERYNNLYTRRSYDERTNSYTSKIGFHTNRATKGLLVARLIEAIRDGSLIERDPQACNEYDTYEQTDTGAYAARRGHHDDILMTRAIALVVADEYPPLPPVVLPRRPLCNGW